MEKVVFYLMNKKGLCVLERFLGRYESSNVEYVVLARDKNVKDDYYLEIKSLCNKNLIKHYDKNETIPVFEGYKFSVGWRWIIKDSHNLIVLHDSILPKYRGFSPLVNMLIAGEDHIGVTALFASQDYDRGRIIDQRVIAVRYPIKIDKAINLIGPLYGDLVNDISDIIFNKKQLIGQPQDDNEASYSLWRDAQDYQIDWSRSSQEIRRTVDALSFPYDGAKTLMNQDRVILDEVEEYPDVYIENRDVGKVIFMEDGFPIVVCGVGLIKIIEARFHTGESIIPLPNFRIRFGGKS